MSKVPVTPRKRRSAEPRDSQVGVTYLNLNSPGVLVGSGYHRLLDAPEVASAIWSIADLISSMPIHLMENRPNGDVRVHDQLARKIDVNPWSLGTRQLWIQWIVETMLTRDDAVVIPRIVDGHIADLIPAPNATLHRAPGAEHYYARYAGAEFHCDDILHFRVRPNPDEPWRGQGVRLQLSQVVDSLVQTAETKTAYMSSEYKPPIVIAVNSDSPLSNKTEREAFAASYLKRDRKDMPLIIPADLMNIVQAKPLSLTDLAIKDGVELDKKTVASVIGVPGFLLGVGSFNKEEWNTFISRKILPIATVIVQELTKKILVSDSRYFRFNSRGMYAYSLSELSTVAKDWRAAGLMTGNEARNWIDLTPLAGLDKLVMLENYIPAEKLGDQSKLVNGGTEKEGAENA